MPHRKGLGYDWSEILGQTFSSADGESWREVLPMTFWGEKGLAALGAFRWIIVESKEICIIWISRQRGGSINGIEQKIWLICNNKDLAHTLETENGGLAQVRSPN